MIKRELTQTKEALGQKKRKTDQIIAKLEASEQATISAQEAENKVKDLLNALNVETQEIAKYILAKRKGTSFTLETARANAARITENEISKSSFQRLYTAVNGTS